MSGTKGLFCSGLELLTWLLPSPFDRLLLLFRWLPRGFSDEDREEDELFDWYEGFIKLSLNGGVSRRVGGTMGPRLCFTFTFLPMSVWFGLISLVLKERQLFIENWIMDTFLSFGLPFVLVIFFSYCHSMSGGLIYVVVRMYPHLIRNGTEYTQRIPRDACLLYALKTAPRTFHIQRTGQGELERCRVIRRWQTQNLKIFTIE